MSDEQYCDHRTCGDVSWSKGTNITWEGQHITHYSETARHSHDADGSGDHWTLLQRDESGKHGSKSDDIYISILDSKVVGDSVLLDLKEH